MVRFTRYTSASNDSSNTRCPHCNIDFYNPYALSAHQAKCSSKNSIRSYTRSNIISQINRGDINPTSNTSEHHILYNRPSLDAMASSTLHEQDNTSDIDYGDNNPLDNLPHHDHYDTQEAEANFSHDGEDDSTNDDDFHPNGLADVDDEDDDDESMDYIVDTPLPMHYIESVLKSDYFKSSQPPNTSNSDYVRKTYDNSMKVNVTCWTHLLIIVNHYGGSAQLYNAIVKFITNWYADYPKVFDTSSGKHLIWSRSRLVKELADKFQTQYLKPKDHTCILPTNGEHVTVPVVDFEAMAINLLDSDYVLSQIAPGIDTETFRPIVDEDTHENNPDAIVGEKHDGWAYRMGIKINTNPESDPIYERPFPVLIHDDYTHACTNQYLKLNPLQIMPAMLSNKAQSDFRNWRVGAILPNISAARVKEGKTSKTGINNLKDYHAVLDVALSSFRECCERGGFYWKDRQGRTVLMKPYIHCRLGDSAGHSENVAKIQASSTRCIMRECKCTFDDLVHFPPRCQPLQYSDYVNCNHDPATIFHLASHNNLVSLHDTSMCYTNKEYAKHISYYHGIDVAWRALPNSDPYFGVVGISALDFLHLFKGGTLKYKIIAERNIIGPKESNSRVKGLVNSAFSQIRARLMRNAERDIYPMSNRHGYFSTVGLSCNEVAGNNFGYFVFLNTTYGTNLVKPCFDELEIDYDEYLETVKLLFSWERFFLQPNKRSDIKKSAYATLRLMQRIIEHIPRKVSRADGKTPGSNGWHILKFHGMWLIPFLVQKFGCVRGFDTDNNEKNHKTAVKGHLNYTNRQQSKFASQIAKNEHIRLTLEIASEAIRPHIPFAVRGLGLKSVAKTDTDHRYIRYMEDVTSDEEGEDDASNDEDDGNVDYSDVTTVLFSSETDYGNEPVVCKLSGGYQLAIEIDNRNRRQVTHRWNYDSKNIAGIETNVLVEVAIADYHKKYCTLYEEAETIAANIEVQCYTRVNLDGCIYHAAQDFKGAPWYDWANVHFGETHDINTSMNCAGHIMGFFKYISPNVPTYNRVEIDNLYWDEIVDETEADPSLYMVVHCSNNSVDFRDIRKDFVTSFAMTPLSELYILPAAMINGPMLVVPDMINDGTFCDTNFKAYLPKSQQGVYFQRYCHKEDIDYEIDMNEETRFDSDYNSGEDDYESDEELHEWTVTDIEDDNSQSSLNYDSDEEDDDSEGIGMNEDEELAWDCPVACI